jgi:hypothetical protein
MASPFNLQVGSTVFVSIVAYNEIGDSPSSVIGSGAVIQISTEPDAPLNLRRSTSVKFDKTSISLEWSDGVRDGNQKVLDYRIMI